MKEYQKEKIIQSSLRDSALNFAKNLRGDEQNSFGLGAESKLQTNQDQTMEELKPGRRQKEPSNYEDNINDRLMNIFAQKQSVPSVKQQDIKIDSKRVLTLGLLLLLIEYFIYFLMQLLSYFVISDFWISTTYVLGTVLIIIYLAVAIFLATNVNNRQMGFLFLLKSLEFIMYMVLMGWGVAYLEFSVIALSYMPIINIMLVIVLVSLKDSSL
jgi:hypothetical protein